MRGKANCCFLARVQLSVLHPGGGRAMHRRLLSPVLKRRPPLVRLPTTAVVSSVDETVSATCAPDLRLFGFNIWFASLEWGREREPSGGRVRPGTMVAAAEVAGESPGACRPAGPPVWRLFIPAEAEPEFRL